MLEKLTIHIKKISPEAKIPTYATDGASGADLYSVVDRVIPSGTFDLIPTGIAVAIPAGFEAQIRPRSGFALKYGVTLLNTPGTIDSDYRGEVKIIVINLGKKEFIIKKGMRIAQMVFSKVERANFQLVKELTQTVRGEGGFGHSNS